MCTCIWCCNTTSAHELVDSTVVARKGWRSGEEGTYPAGGGGSGKRIVVITKGIGKYVIKVEPEGMGTTTTALPKEGIVVKVSGLGTIASSHVVLPSFVWVRQHIIG